jgi:hypothetical protein
MMAAKEIITEDKCPEVADTRADIGKLTVLVN